jgi:Tfp pilus assembly protein PilV
MLHHDSMKRNQYGFSRVGMTLVEVMIATVVFVVGFSGIMATATHVSRLVRAAREETQAVMAAQHALEIIKTYSWVRLSLMEGESVFDISGNSVFAALNDPSCKVLVMTVPGETDRMRLISAKVRWRQLNGKYAERELASFVARKKRLR